MPAPTPDSATPERAAGTFGEIRLAGVPVRFHFTFYLALTLLTAAGLSGGPGWALDALFVLLLFVSILLHELAHAIVARHRGIPASGIVMYPVGGVAHMPRRPPPRDDLWIALAGPFANLAAGSALLWGAGHSEPAVSDLLSRTGLANVAFGAFNLLPAAPMDGGRIFRAAVTLWKGERTATLASTRVARTIAILLGIGGIAAGQVILLVVAFLVYVSAYHEGVASLSLFLTRGLPVRSAMMTDFRTLPHGATFREAAQVVLASAQQDLPVLHGDQVVGLLGREAFLRGLGDLGPDAYVSAAMDREFMRLGPDTDLSEAFERLARDGACGLVMEGDRLNGILTRDNISEFVMLRRMGVLADG
ncbi:MAG: site-2 protease family protein [Bryobacteraceae bacterium]